MRKTGTQEGKNTALFPFFLLSSFIILQIRAEHTMDDHKYLTNAEQFTDVSRGNPQPHKLKGDDLVKARLTPETWRLEIVSDGSTKIEKPRRIEDGTAIDFATLRELGK